MRRFSDQDNFGAVHTLLTQCFAYMEGRIDPPSSLNRLTAAGLRALSECSEIWVIEEGQVPVACMVLTPKVDTLYLGKLAVSPLYRNTGLARKMTDQALRRARILNFESITLQTRVELVENHAAFASLGFRKTSEAAHPGYNRITEVTMMQDVVPDGA